MILEQTRMEVLFGSDKSLSNVLKLSDPNLKYLKKLMVFDPPSENLKKLAEEKDIKILKFHDLISY